VKKLRVYLDTSIISHLDAPDTPEKMEETIALWNEINQFDVFISDILIEELENCSEPKKSKLYEFLKDIDVSRIEETEEAIALTGKYIEYGVLNEKSRDDCRRIALATVSECDYIISWNLSILLIFRRLIKFRQSINCWGIRISKSYRRQCFLGGEMG